MNNRRMQGLIAVVGLVCLTGCAEIVTRSADLNGVPRGVRVYPPKVYLLVDEVAKESTWVLAPDMKRAYDIKPCTIFSKQAFHIKIDGGQITELTANQDTTHFLTFLQQAGQLGAKGAGLAVSANAMKGTFGLTTGIYEMRDDGTFMKLSVADADKQ